MNIDDLNTSISDMSDKEAFALIHAIRSNRRRKKTKTRTRKIKTTKKLSVKNLNKDQKKALIAILMEELNET